MSSVSDIFQGAFCTALELDGEAHAFAFQDGKTLNGRINATINCLLITTDYIDWHTHSHYSNTVIHQTQLMVVMRASDVPGEAALYSNAFLDVDGVSYRIDSSQLTFGIYELRLVVIGTD